MFKCKTKFSELNLFQKIKQLWSNQAKPDKSIINYFELSTKNVYIPCFDTFVKDKWWIPESLNRIHQNINNNEIG